MKERESPEMEAYMRAGDGPDLAAENSRLMGEIVRLKTFVDEVAELDTVSTGESRDALLGILQETAEKARRVSSVIGVYTLDAHTAARREALDDALQYALEEHDDGASDYQRGAHDTARRIAGRIKDAIAATTPTPTAATSAPGSTNAPRGK